MSSFPAGGGVVIPFSADMSAVEAAIANLRAHPPQIGVSFMPGQATSAPPATTFGAAAFGSPGLQPWQVSPAIQALQSLQANVGTAGGAAGMSAASVQQFSTAVAEFSVAVGRSGGGDGGMGGGGVPEPDEDAGGSGRTGGRGRSQWGRFRRMATLGYAAYQGFAIAERAVQLGHQDAMADYTYGSGTPGANLAHAQNQMSFAKSIPLSGIFGLIGNSQEKAELAIARLEDSQKDTQLYARAYGGSDVASAQVWSLNRGTAALGIGPGYNRQRAEITNRYYDAVDTSAAQIRSERYIANAETNQEERSRKQFLADVHERENKEKNEALGRKRDAELVELDRTNRLEITQRESGINATEALIQHNPLGAQIEHLKAARDAAISANPDKAAEIRFDFSRKYVLALQEDEETRTQQTSQRQFRIQSTEHLLNYQPLQARLNDIEAERSEARAQAVIKGGKGLTGEERAADLSRTQSKIDEEFNGKINLERQRESDDIQFSASQRAFGTAATGALLSHDPLSAQIIQNEKSREAAIINLEKSGRAGGGGIFSDIIGGLNVGSTNIGFGVSEALIRQRNREQLDTEFFSIRNDTTRLQIQNNLSRSPGERINDSAIFDVQTKLQSDVRHAVLSGEANDPRILPGLIARATEQATQLQVRKLDALTAEEVDPLRTQLNGPNTEDLTQAFKDIADMKESLQALADAAAKLAQGQ